MPAGLGEASLHKRLKQMHSPSSTYQLEENSFGLSPLVSVFSCCSSLLEWLFCAAENSV